MPRIERTIDTHMRIALAQINPTVGDIAGNARKIQDYIVRAKNAGADLVVFPELCIIGYPPKDLLLKPQFIDDNLRALKQIASGVHGITAVVGYADRNQQPIGRPLHNCVAVLRDGKIDSRHIKTLLPTYDVFDESRYFEPGPAAPHLFQHGDTRVGVSICEDLWNDERLIARRLYHQNPIADLQLAGASLIINSSASPFVENKPAFRHELFGQQAKHFQRPILIVNQVGGNDELVFDGNSCAFDAAGNIIAHAKDFEEDLVVFDLPVNRDTGIQPLRAAMPSSGIESIYKALVLGLQDYVRKCGFKSVVLGLSGGIDSALTAAIAVAALGKDKVVGVAMPSRYSSDHSVNDARALAKNLGIEFHVVPIKDVHQAYEQTLSPTFQNPEPRTLNPSLGDDLTEQNIQARIRGGVLMAFSNRYNHLLLTTGNKSELAVGYCTLYGDMCGGLAVISDVPKVMVYELARVANRRHNGAIPEAVFTKPPSAELRPDQKDSDSIPEYDVLDPILKAYVEENESPECIAQRLNQPLDLVRKIARMVDANEYKRQQAAPGIRVTSKAFGIGRRFPIAQTFKE